MWEHGVVGGTCSMAHMPLCLSVGNKQDSSVVLALSFSLEGGVLGSTQVTRLAQQVPLLTEPSPQPPRMFVLKDILCV